MRVALTALLFVVTLAGAWLFGSVGPDYVRAQVAPAYASEPADCTMVFETTSSVGEVEYFFCESDIAGDFFANNFGFIAPKE